MRRTTFPGIGLESSVLGFGCASLGSRISGATGLRALSQAHEAGVTWYDVAPPYGAGEGEAILGAFLKGRRDTVRICTKVGLTNPERNRLMKLVYALARPVAGPLKGLRKTFRGVQATRYRRLALDAATITASLERSLRRLGTDHVDVFALHDPALVDVTRDEVLRALEGLIASGKARHLAVAGTLPACLAGLGQGLPFDLFQLADDPRTGALAALRQVAGRPVATITHSVFGVDGSHQRLLRRLEGDALAVGRLRAAGYGQALPVAASSLLIDRAFAANPDGVVLASMFSDRNRGLNLSRAARMPSPEAIVLVRDLLGADAQGEPVAA